MIVYADGTNWDPGSGAGTYQYVGGAWVIQRSGVEPSSYSIITDGTTPAPAEVAGDTFKLRAGTGLLVAVQNDDATHGDNALYSLSLKDLASVAPVLGDKLPFMDVSNSDANARTTIQILLDLIGTLTTEASPDALADFLALYDASGAVAKKVALSSLSGLRKLISTTATTSGNSVDITVPSGYRDLLIFPNGVSMTGGASLNAKFSEDAGSTFLTQSHYLSNAGGSNSAAGGTNHSVMQGNTGGGDNIVFIEMSLRNYGSNANKGSLEVGYYGNSGSNAFGWAGGRAIFSSAPINLINFNTGGTFDAGAIELWGIL
jgi:hypothetical protein